MFGIAIHGGAGTLPRKLAAAIGTGGMTGKRFSRIGGSPIIGAGPYADNRSRGGDSTLIRLSPHRRLNAMLPPPRERRHDLCVDVSELRHLLFQCVDRGRMVPKFSYRVRLRFHRLFVGRDARLLLLHDVEQHWG